MEAGPLVSIVIPTCNSEKTLARCLDSVRNQTYGNIEVIIADECSDDRTVDVARKYSSRVYVTEAKERGAQKNLGIDKATGEYICFIDSDMQLAPAVIDESVQLITSKESIGGIIIPERSVGTSFWVKVRDFERSFYAGTAVESARFFRSDLVERVGGFDEDIVFFEESVLPQKIENLGYSVTARITSEILHHEDDFSLWRHLLKRYYYGKTTRAYSDRFGMYFKKQYGPGYRLKIFVANDRFLRRPVLSLFVLIIKMLELVFNELGAFSSRIARNNRSE